MYVKLHATAGMSTALDCLEPELVKRMHVYTMCSRIYTTYEHGYHLSPNWICRFLYGSSSVNDRNIEILKTKSR